MQTMQPVQYGSATSSSHRSAGKPMYRLATARRFLGSGYWAVTGLRNAVFSVTTSPSRKPIIRFFYQLSAISFLSPAPSQEPVVARLP